MVTSLNNLSHRKLNVNKQSLWDSLNLYVQIQSKKYKEERASGKSPEIQEKGTLLEEMREKEVEAKKKPSTGNKKQSLQREKATAEKIRSKAMKTGNKLKNGWRKVLLFLLYVLDTYKRKQ